MNLLVCRNFAFYFIYCLCTTYSYYSTCNIYFAFTPRGRTNLRIPVALFAYSSRGCAVCYRVSFRWIRWAIRAAFTSRWDSISLCVAQPLHLIKPRYLVLKLRIIFHRAMRRGLDRTYASRPCSFVVASFYFTSSRQKPGSLARNLSVSVARWSLTQREATPFSMSSRRLPSTSLKGGKCRGYLLVLATKPCCRRYTSLIDAKSLILFC